MKKLKLILFAFVIAFSFTSCELSDESTIDGHDLTGGPAIVGWANKSVSESYFSDQGIIDKEYPINILGYDNNVFENDINYTISVVANETTANNNEYVLNSTTGTIPAGNDFSNFSIGINTANFSPTQPTKVTFLIETSTSGSIASSLSNKMVMEFVGCASNLEALYSTGTVTKFDDIFYHSPSMPGISYTSGDPIFFEFKDVCGDLTITKTAIGSGYAIVQPQAGYVEETTGNIIFPSVSLGDLDFYQNIRVELIKQ